MDQQPGQAFPDRDRQENHGQLPVPPTLPILQRAEKATPSEELKTYYSSLIPLATLLQQFEGYGNFYKFTPAPQDPGLKRLEGTAYTCEVLTSAAQTRIGLSLGPLLELFTVSNDRRIADAILAVVQGLSQMDYQRRYLYLTAQWGDSAAAKRALQHAADQKTFSLGQDLLLGKTFADSIKTMATALTNPLKTKASSSRTTPYTRLCMNFTFSSDHLANFFVHPHRCK